MKVKAITLLVQELVAHARKNGSIIVYDAAYALYISDRNCPKSIFEIEGGTFWLPERDSRPKHARCFCTLVT
jgi:LL-diaminopimelate aminotransferase